MPRRSASAFFLSLTVLAGVSPRPSVAPQGADENAQARRLESLYEGALVGAQDWQEAAETPGYRHLLEIVSRYKDEELLAKASHYLSFAGALSSPDLWRGEIVRLRGLVASVETIRLANPLDEHVDVYRAVVAETDGSEAVFVDFLEPPPPDLSFEKDVVDTEGVFFRTIGFENKKGLRTFVPQIVAKSIRRLDPEAVAKKSSWDTITTVLICAGVVYLVVRILTSVRGKKSQSDASRAQASALIRQRAAQALAHKPKGAAKPEHESC